MELVTIQIVVEKMIGKIDPIGESRTDEIRFENLKDMCELAESLVSEINSVAIYNKDRVEYSMRRAGEYADKFLKENLGIKELK